MIVVIGTAICLFGSVWHRVSLTGVKNWYDVCYIWFLGCAGTWTWIFISQFIAKQNGKLKALLMYIGENTMIVLALHFSCFKLVNLIKVHYYGLSQPYGAFPILADDPSGNSMVWFVLYILVGVGIPIAIKWAYDHSRFAGKL